jgi:hypothetical protein
MGGQGADMIAAVFLNIPKLAESPQRNQDIGRFARIPDLDHHIRAPGDEGGVAPVFLEETDGLVQTRGHEIIKVIHGSSPSKEILEFWN